MAGYYLMHRNWHENPVFQNEPFCERMAWVWLIEEAAWKPTRKRVGGNIVTLERGQLAHSTRFMAEAWGWSKSRVSRFLRKLRQVGMIAGQPAGQGNVVLSICNYDNYQVSRDSSGTASEAPSGTVAGQQRDSSGTNQNEGKEGKEGKEYNKGGAQARSGKEYAFVGYVIRLNHRDFSDWRQSFYAIPDLMAELRSLDHYYAENPPKDGKWFHRVSRCLKDKHERNLQRQTSRESEMEKMFRQCI
jgi:hypothetical protein